MQGLEYRINWKYFTPYVVADRLVLNFVHRNAKFTIGNNFVCDKAKCYADITDPVVFFIGGSMK